MNKTKITKLFAIGIVLSIMMIAMFPVHASTYTLTVSVNNSDWGTTDPIPANATAWPVWGFWIYGV